MYEITMTKEVMKLKESKESYMGGLGGRKVKGKVIKICDSIKIK